MIPLTLQPEPATFNQAVRVPGQAFLQATGVNVGDGLSPRSRWSGRDYWRRHGLGMLHTAYDDICCYLCMYIENSAVARRNFTGGSVEHLVPVGQDAWKAYEWNNYALAGQLVNRDRGNNSLISPFVLDFYPFELDLPSGVVFTAQGLTLAQRAIAIEINDVLKFDDRPQHERDRASYYEQFDTGVLTGAQLARFAPFVWYEIQRQGLVINEN
ncbi:MAG: hypothetical protein ACERJ1_16810 [Halodesulfovibrio sp.]|uniref:hypothetical protein n=1 Tax=Halodesulfovibrio sp. TaxID=1912772 RepID=UPI00359E6FF0